MTTQTRTSASRPSPWLSVRRWMDAWAGQEVPVDPATPDKVDWLRVVPLMALHLGCLGLLWVGWSPFAVGVAILLYAIRMVAITGCYHRYFSHRAFRASRPVQFAMAVVGASSAQRGPLWWASQHRRHHANADQPEDLHSPGQRGFAWAHLGWLMSERGFRTHLDAIPDLAEFKELRFLDRFDWVVPVLLAASLFGLGELLAVFAPSLGTNGAQLLTWGFFVSTTVLLHATLTINSLAHGEGRKPYVNRDESRNSLLLALLTFGEGWHNNHHHYPASARQGHRWWQVDGTFYVLWFLARFRVISDLIPVPARVLASARNRAGSTSA